MYVKNINNEYDGVTNYAINDNEDVNIIIKYLLPSIPSSMLLLCFISLVLYTMIKPLMTNK